MATKHPYIARLRDRLSRRLRHLVGIAVQFGFGFFILPQIQIPILETDKLQIEVQIGQLTNLDSQNIIIPARFFRQPVISDNVAFELRFAPA